MIKSLRTYWNNRKFLNFLSRNSIVKRYFSKQMKLAIVIYLAFCMSMVMTAPRPVNVALVALPTSAIALPTVQLAGSALSVGTSIAGLKTLATAGILAANSANSNRS